MGFSSENAALPKPRAPIELVRPSFYGMLICYYAAILGYGITASISGVLAVQHTAGYTFAFIWALLLGAGALLAGAGVVFSIYRRSHWFELVGTIVIIALMAGYTVAIFLFALSPGGDVARLSAFWLPVVIAIMPVWRISVMATDGSLGKKQDNAGAS